MWSIYDTCILITGMISLIVAVVPVHGISSKHRVIGGAVGGGLILLSFVLGSLTSFSYPGLVVVMPFIAALLVGAVISQAVRRDQPGVGHGELGHTTSHAPSAVEADSAVALAFDGHSYALPAATPAVHPDLVAARSADTTPEELARLAHSSSALWPDIAANPAAYAGLLSWLAQHGGPEITEIIARRSTS
ncbi:hypothetical protein [Agromyces sp. PvR057]|uniref:variant leucine-rich repeat-containing protein n=1 Tax=Agromyces sp. PvR057 TaxID=3156403 RepID=UPI00339880D9